MEIHQKQVFGAIFEGRGALLGAILAQDDPQDRLSIDLGNHMLVQKCFKNRYKNKAIFKHPQNLVFCARRSQRLQNGIPKQTKKYVLWKRLKPE